MKSRIDALLLSLLSLWFSAQANALQVFEVGDGQTVTAKMSLKELTRIRLLGAELSEIYGAEGPLRIEKDGANAQVFLRLTDPFAKDPINVFVVDDLGRTYTLILLPADVPAESVVLKPIGPTHDEARRWERSQSYEQTLTELIQMMAREDAPAGYELTEHAQTVPLWKEARVVLQRRYVGDALRGEVYQLTNIDTQAMVIEERELYQRGVLAVALDQLSLAPGESTRVYVVSEREGGQL